MRFSELLALADDETLQELLGADALRLMHSLDPDMIKPSRLKKVLLEMHNPQEILRSPDSRRSLLMLLPVEEARRLTDLLLPLNQLDPFRALASLDIRPYSESERLLFQFFGLAPEEKPQQEMKPNTCSVDSLHGLFSHQRTAVRELLACLSEEPRCALLHMPTGAGKTRIAMNVICQHLCQHEKALVIWLAYSEELCEQAVDEFEASWRHLGNRTIKVFRFWGKHDFDLARAEDGLVVAGLGKIYNAAMKSIQFIATFSDRVSLVIIDEAHQAIAPTYRLVLETIYQKQPNTALLGLTATPGRTWNDIDEDERLAKFFAKRKVGLRIEGYSNPVQFLIDEGYLAKPRFIPLFHSGNFELSQEEREELAEALDIPKYILQRLAEDEVRNLKIIQKAEEILHSHSRVILFAASVKHAELLSTVLCARGHRSCVVTSKSSDTERRRVIDEYRGESDDPMIICNFGVLTAGFDAPRTNAVIIARPTKSLVLYFQMAGRALRGPKVQGNKEADIITVIDLNLPGFGDIGDAFLNWEDVWDE